LNWNQTGNKVRQDPVVPQLGLVKASAPVDPGTFNQATASCPSGYVVTGGGIDISGSDPGGANSGLVERYSGPVFQETGWTVGETKYHSQRATLTFTVVAICVLGSTTGVGKVQRSR
jgi:hypothetical protein